MEQEPSPAACFWVEPSLFLGGGTRDSWRKGAFGGGRRGKVVHPRGAACRCLRALGRGQLFTN